MGKNNFDLMFLMGIGVGVGGHSDCGDRSLTAGSRRGRQWWSQGQSPLKDIYKLGTYTICSQTYR